jgi:hypothetical protein
MRVRSPRAGSSAGSDRSGRPSQTAPDLKRHHERLIELRRKLLAHTDDPSSRRIAIFTRGYFGDKPVVTEGRAPVNVAGIGEVIELLRVQEERLSKARDELAIRLQDLVPWPDGVMLELDVSGEITFMDASSEVFVDTSLPDEPSDP